MDQALITSLSFTMTYEEHAKIFCKDLKCIIGANGLPKIDYAANGWFDADGIPKIQIYEVTADELEGWIKDRKAEHLDADEFFNSGMDDGEEEEEDH